MLSGARTKSFFCVIHLVIEEYLNQRTLWNERHKTFLYLQYGGNSLHPGIVRKLLSGSRWRGKEQSSQPWHKKTKRALVIKHTDTEQI